MAQRKVAATIQVRVDDVNSLKCKTLLAYCGALHYTYEIQSDKDIKRSVRRRLVVGEPRIISDEEID